MTGTNDVNVQLDKFAGKIFDAKCCTLIVVDGSMPGCLRCSQKGVFICIEQEMEEMVPLCLDGVDSRGFDKSKTLCLLQRGNAACVKPPILTGGPLCKGVAQCCCLEQRFACPCDDEVPCAFAMCCVQCFRDYKVDFKVMADAPKVAFGGGAPESEEMSR